MQPFCQAPACPLERNMEAERLNAIANALTDLRARSLDLRRFL